MDGHGIKPPDKHQSGGILDENEMEIKQEPTVKQEPEDDSIATVSYSITINDGVVLDNSIVDEKVNGNDDFVNFCELNVVKPEVKIEKVSDKANQVPGKRFGQAQMPQNNVKRFSKESEQKTDGMDGIGKKSGLIRSNEQENQSEGRANEKRHKCSLCDYATDFTTNLKRHMVKHTGERPFLCSFCPKRFTTKQSLRFHIKTHVDEFLFRCSNCLQGFNHNEEKLEHEADCKIRRYECHLCKEYSTLHKPHLVEHLRVHNGDRPFQCDQCSKKFHNSGNLRRHRKTHTNPRPSKFKCSVCFKNFKQQKEKENHEVNCNRRGYKCEMCKSYTTDHKSHLVNHMRFHTGEKPFRCVICSKYFAQKGNLMKHRKIHN